MDMTTGSAWVFDASPYPITRARLRSLLPSHTDIHFWLESQGVAELADQAGLTCASAMQPDAPDVILAELDNDSGRLERACVRWSEAGVVLLGMQTSAAFSIPSDRSLALLSLDVTPAQLVPAIQAVAVGLSVIHPDFLHPEQGIQAVLTRANQPDDVALLTVRELQVLKSIADGLPNKTIAVELGISEHTVKFHVSSLFTKLGVTSRTEAVTIATRRGILII